MHNDSLNAKELQELKKIVKVLMEKVEQLEMLARNDYLLRRNREQ